MKTSLRYFPLQQHKFHKTNIQYLLPEKCGDPFLPSNAQFINNATEYDIDYQAVFQCEAGFEPEIAENNILACNSSGQWQGGAINCLGV